MNNMIRALPGDPELDLDVSGLVLVSVLRHNNEFIVTGGGGSGRWESDGEMEDIVEIDELELTFGFATVNPFRRRSLCKQVNALYQLLVRWNEQEIALRICAAPGKHSCVSDGTTTVFIPRSSAKGDF